MREAATICPAPCKLTFDLESGVRVTCDVRYLCANFSLPRPLCSRLRPNVRDKQTSDRQTTDVHHRLMPPTLGTGHNKQTTTATHHHHQQQQQSEQQREKMHYGSASVEQYNDDTILLKCAPKFLQHSHINASQ